MRIQLLAIAALTVSCTQDRRFRAIEAGSDQVKFEALVHPEESCALLLGKEWTAQQHIDSGRLYRGISQFDGEFQTLEMTAVAPGKFSHLQTIPAGHPGTTWAAQVVVTAPGPPVYDAWFSPVLTVTRAADGGASIVLGSRVSRVLSAHLGRLIAAGVGAAVALCLAYVSGRWRTPRRLRLALPLLLILGLVVLRISHTDPPRSYRWIPADMETGVSATPLWWPMRFNETFDRSFGMLGKEFSELYAYLKTQRRLEENFQVLISQRSRIGDGRKFTLGVLLAFLFDGEVLSELREKPGQGLCLLIEMPATENALLANSIGQVVLYADAKPNQEVPGPEELPK